MGSPYPTQNWNVIHSNLNLFQTTLNIMTAHSSDTVNLKLTEFPVSDVIIQLINRLIEQIKSSENIDILASTIPALIQILDICKDDSLRCSLNTGLIEVAVGKFVKEFYSKVLTIQHCFVSGFGHSDPKLLSLSEVFVLCLNFCPFSVQTDIVKLMQSSLWHFVGEKPVAYEKVQNSSEFLDVRLVIEMTKRVLRKASTADFKVPVVKEVVDRLFNPFLASLPFFDETVTGQITCTLLNDMLLSCSGNEAASTADVHLKSLWDTIIDIYRESQAFEHEVFNCKPLIVLCGLADTWFPVSISTNEQSREVVKNRLDLRQDPVFWNLLQQGLKQMNPLARKQAMYLLKRIVDICHEAGELRCPSSEGSKEVPVFWWSKTCSQKLANLWEDFILLMETFEEKQVHIIKPLLKRFDNLLEATTEQGGSLLHTSWLVVILSRSLIHENIFVIRWAVNTALEIDLMTCPLFDQGQQSYLSGQFLCALKEIKLYVREQGIDYGSCPKTGDALAKFFLSCWETLKTKSRRAEFFSKVLLTLNAQSWGPIPVVFICRALSKLPGNSIWDKQAVMNIREVVVTNLRTVETYIRGATQSYLAEALVNLLDISQVTPSDWAYCTSTLCREESIGRNKSLWFHFVAWLQENVNEDAPGDWKKNLFIKGLEKAIFTYLKEGYCSGLDPVEAIKLTRTFLLCCDANILPTKSATDNANNTQTAEDVLAYVIDVLLSINTHAYLPTGKADRAIHFLLLLLEEFGPVPESDLMENSVTKMVQHVVTRCAKQIVQYIEARIGSGIEQMECLDNLSVYCSILSKFLEWNLWLQLNQSLCSLTSTCTTILQQTAELHYEVSLAIELKKVSAMSIIGSLAKDLSFSLPASSDKLHLGVHQLLLDFAQDVKIEQINLVKPSTADSGCSDADDRVVKQTWGKVVCQYSTSQWWLLYYFSCLYGKAPFPFSTPESALQENVEALSLGSGDSALPMLYCLKNNIAQVAAELQNENLIVNALNVAWNRIEEEHKSAAYWQLFEAYVSVAYQTAILCYPAGSPIVKFLLENCNLILHMGEERTSMANIVVKHLCAALQQPEMLQHASKFVNILVEACTYGAVHRKNERYRLDACAFIENQKGQCAVNELQPDISKSDLQVRILVLNWLCCLQTENTEHERLAEEFILELIEKHKEVNQTKSYRSFANSFHHRIKQRVMQALVLLQKFINESNRKRVWQYIWDTLMVECQPSVRNMLEWLALCIIIRFPSFISDVWHQHKTFADTSSMSACSLLLMLSHVGPWLEEETEQQKFYDSAFTHLLPLCMNHHFSTRIHAQATICKMWRQCKSLGLDNILSKFALVEGCIQFNDGSNATKNTLKLMESYFMATFDPVRDYSIETIFLTLPKLTCLTDEEWLPPEMFSEMDPTWLDANAHKLLSLYNGRDSLNSSKSGPWRVKIHSAPLAQEDEESKNDGTDVQKKIMPWRLMTPDPAADEYRRDFLDSTTQPGQLILVTSLISKVPNLGGLCRTSEIFGIKEYVIGSMRHLVDKNFSSLSVTAEKWIPIREVPSEYLQNFLIEKQRDGYTLVGAEQTANSRCLTDYEFPMKTVLILGNEREGIPASLISLLDACVEIPQQGVIRSLNVHVSGALLMWEYTRQMHSHRTKTSSNQKSL